MVVGDKLAELLAKNGVEYMYGVPGGQTLPLYEGIRKLPGQIQHVLMRDERSAGYAADAYARLTGRVGVCDATVGPGATNLVSPLAEAYCSSIPLLAIISDIPVFWEHRRVRGNASQAIQQIEIFQTISKWQTTLVNPRSLEDTLDTAFRMATTGKPGPVVISVPMDVAMTDFSYQDSDSVLPGAAFPRFRSAPDLEEVLKAAQLLRNAKKPVLVVGGGVHISGASRQVKDLAEKLQAPIITSISGKGVIEETHPLAFGVTGSFGNPAAAAIMQQADLVFFIGCKIGQLTTFGYRVPQRTVAVIHLDADPEEIGRNYKNSVPILADARLGLDAVNVALTDTKTVNDWDFPAFKKNQEQWYQETAANAPQAEQPLRPQTVMDALNQVLTEDDLVVCDASFSSGWAAAYLKLTTSGRRFLAPRGLAGLGWGAPAAVGAALATGKGKRVFCLAGDGGFSYSVQELEVMKRLDLPIVVLVLNNDVLGWIKHAQKDSYQGNYIATDFSHVDFAMVAKGFGARGYTVRTLEELKDCLTKEKSMRGPVVLDIATDPWQNPMVNA
ncbi:MAG: thiamine pyrophosphate-binding protein [Deltaproteobacteria bacterium]|nr:thiamine pyrophosphate-binding protein [Deltaproteobacteria bacterium]